MLNPFKAAHVPASPSLWQRLARRPNTRGAADDLRRLFSVTPASEVSSSRISAVLLEHRVHGDAAHGMLEALWQEAMQSFVADNRLSDAELAYLRRLVYLFDLPCDRVEEMTSAAKESQYSAQIKAALADGTLTAEEWAALGSLADSLRLAEDTVQRLLREPLKDELQKTLTKVLADGRLSPAEVASFEARAKELHVNPEFDAGMQAKMNRAKSLWAIENGELPEVFAPINLQRGERCHLVTHASWQEMRSRTVRVNYAGPVASIRICKGLRYRVGSFTPQRIQQQELVEVAAGELYVTNKRVILDGDSRNKSVRLSALIGVDIYSDGLILEKASGKNPHLLDIPDGEYAGAVVSAALAAS
jgi:hypothetical protein